MRETGIREVEEECGITSPVIESELRPRFMRTVEKAGALVEKDALVPHALAKATKRCCPSSKRVHHGCTLDVA